jgi:hypothetical protein
MAQGTNHGLPEEALSRRPARAARDRTDGITQEVPTFGAANPSRKKPPYPP